MQSIENYFSGERLQCSLGIAIAAFSIIISLYFLFQVRTDFFKGIAYPSLLVSAMLLAICIGIVVRTPKDITRVQGFMQNEKVKITAEEIPRMEKVMKSFRMIMTVEVILFFAGVTLFFYASKGNTLKGIALGLCIQSVIMYIFDHLAQSRGKIYLDSLHTLGLP